MEFVLDEVQCQVVEKDSWNDCRNSLVEATLLQETESQMENIVIFSRSLDTLNFSSDLRAVLEYSVVNDTTRHHQVIGHHCRLFRILF